MYLLCRRDDGKLSLEQFIGQIPSYAILSHRWLAAIDEPTFADLGTGQGQKKAGYAKLEKCADLADKDGLKYFWVDTVCIDKSSSAELSEAINSMFRYYNQAARCYVLMPDVNNKGLEFLRSVWFTRGWTLQELLAPKSVEFFGADGQLLGSKNGPLMKQIIAATGVPAEALNGQPLSDFTIEERFSWVGRRLTTRPEDMAYCLMGIFNVFMPIIYGEGEQAFVRLHEEIEKRKNARNNTPYIPATMPISPALVYQRNNGYNCFGEVTRVFRFRNFLPMIWKCGECGFENTRDGRTPEDFLVEARGGQRVPPKLFYQRFHQISERYEADRDGHEDVYRCFICQNDERYNRICMVWHLRHEHTYEEIMVTGD